MSGDSIQRMFFDDAPDGWQEVGYLVVVNSVGRRSSIPLDGLGFDLDGWVAYSLARTVGGMETAHTFLTLWRDGAMDEALKSLPHEVGVQLCMPVVVRSVREDDLDTVVSKLRALPSTERVGVLIDGLDLFAEEMFRPFDRKSFEPYAGVYRIELFDYCVSEEDWERVWAMLPAWCELAFRLDNTDRPDFSNGLMMDMSPAEITETWENLPDYNYWPVYYTEADREGRV